MPDAIGPDERILNPDFEPLTTGTIDEICTEVEIQWEYLLITRAVFTANFRNATTSFTTPSFYSDRGIKFEIGMPVERSPTFIRAQHGIAYWHNQNFVIRLFGILDKYGIIRHGVLVGSDVIKLIKRLRNKLGAHNTGRNPTDKADLRQATRIINRLYDKNVNLEQVTEYAIAIDKVLEPMKNQVIQFVKTLAKE